MSSELLDLEDINNYCDEILNFNFPYATQLVEAVKLISLTGCRISEAFDVSRWTLISGNDYSLQPQKGNNLRYITLGNDFTDFKAAIAGDYKPFLGQSIFQLSHIYDKCRTWLNFSVSGSKVTFYIFRYRYIKQLYNSGQTVSQIAAEMGYTSTSTPQAYLDAEVYVEFYEPPPETYYQQVIFINSLPGISFSQYSSTDIINLFSSAAQGAAASSVNFNAYINNYSEGDNLELCNFGLEVLSTFTGWVLIRKLISSEGVITTILEGASSWYLKGYYFSKGLWHDGDPYLDQAVDYYVPIETVELLGVTYNVVTINGTKWLKENFRHNDYEGGIMSYPNSTENEGLMYTYAAATRVVNLISGWHIPTLSELQQLSTAHGNVCRSMRTPPPDWENSTYNGTNTLGFSALGTGYFYGKYSLSPYERLKFTKLWSSTEQYAGWNYNMTLGYNTDNIPIQSLRNEWYALSLRLVED